MRLMRTWPSLYAVVITVGESLVDVFYISILAFLFIFVMAILGRQVRSALVVEGLVLRRVNRYMVALWISRTLAEEEVTSMTFIPL